MVSESRKDFTAFCTEPGEHRKGCLAIKGMRCNKNYHEVTQCSNRNRKSVPKIRTEAYPAAAGAGRREEDALGVSHQRFGFEIYDRLSGLISRDRCNEWLRISVEAVEFKSWSLNPTLCCLPGKE